MHMVLQKICIISAKKILTMGSSFTRCSCHTCYIRNIFASLMRPSRMPTAMSWRVWRHQGTIHRWMVRKMEHPHELWPQGSGLESSIPPALGQTRIFSRRAQVLARAWRGVRMTPRYATRMLFSSSNANWACTTTLCVWALSRVGTIGSVYRVDYVNCVDGPRRGPEAP